MASAGQIEQPSTAYRPIQARIASRLRADTPLAILDCAVVFLAYLLPLVLRYDGEIRHSVWASFKHFALMAVAVHLLVNYLFGLYGQVWRYASVQEARRILIASMLAGAGLFTWGMTLRIRLPLSVMTLGVMLTIAGFGAVRFQSRLFALRRHEVAPPKRARVAVVGAGDAGESIVRDILRNPSCELFPVAFVDDDARKHGLSIHGVRVVGGLDSLPHIAGSMRIEKILLAIPTASSEVYRSVVEIGEEMEIPVLALPSLDEVVGGSFTVRDIRDLRIEDLIGRQLVQTDLRAVETLLRGRRVLVTGAGGSIGSEIVRQVARFGPAALLLLDNDETHVHDVLLDMSLPSGELVPLLADVRDASRVDALLQAHRPEIVFHAAAHKHVPLLEDNPDEAIKTNIVGTANVAESALRAGAQRFINISTDKAINPVSVMGITKHIAERVVRSLDGRGCRFTSVRFGNVVGSRGSVVPTFMRQIAQGGPITVTDPAMTRYFMSISEAVQLVLQAAAMAEGADVFTLDMGEPVNILALARRMIRLAGRVPDRDIAIHITGPRPGERLTEEIMSTDETSEASAHPHIVRSTPPRPEPARLRWEMQHLIWMCERAGAADVRRRLRQIAGREPWGDDAESSMLRPSTLRVVR